MVYGNKATVFDANEKSFTLVTSHALDAGELHVVTYTAVKSTPAAPVRRSLLGRYGLRVLFAFLCMLATSAWRHAAPPPEQQAKKTK